MKSLIVELDAAELAVRIAEACAGMKRPPGCTAKEALAAMDEDCRSGYHRGALAAMEYLRQQIEKGTIPS